MNPHTARVAAVEEYREMVALDRPFVAPPDVTPAERQRQLRAAIEYLSRDSTVFRRFSPSALADQSDEALPGLLRAMLTVRLPGPLPDPVQTAIDHLLQQERARRGVVHASTLSRLGETKLGAAAGRCALWQGDITTLATDAIVNAANETLLGCFEPFHACIDNAIHSAAGPQLREDCNRIMRLQGAREPCGQAKVTRGYNLPARYVLHTVGPIVQAELRPEHEASLAACYRACLDLATRAGGVRTIALCGISTGVFGFPKQAAARVAVRTVFAWLREHPAALDLIVFDVFGADDRAAYDTALRDLAGGAPEA
jgi:O-acetyl-ADP-ribose deacetylase (regulator of RNase III)